ncbi:MAG TPA: pyridoxal-dependent decarboxylase [Acidimicrobiia bacterium]|jgi:aromatic-L-amino-acid decarboxylase|nr:pyridoxal-dependent decarboxylase [Acidimicrobiia bacterium]
MFTSYHMSPDEFRTHGHALVEWVAGYMEGVEDLPIQPNITPGAIRAMLPATAPEAPEDFTAVLGDLNRIVMPGVTHWQSPGWFGYFPANASPPAILGELAAAGLGVQGMLWSTSPACTEIEMVMMDWLVDLLGLPETWKMDGPGGGVIQMSASDATHTALVVARRIASTKGTASHAVAYASSQANSSIEKGAKIAGFEHVRLIDVDGDYAMSPAALEAAVTTDLAAGLTPAFVCSAVGTTGTTAVDPVRRVGEIARARGMWHHVDAAYAGSAMICPEFRHHQDGLELVDSYTFNPHKWMFTNFDCNVFYVADRTALVDTLSITPPYLRNAATESGAVVDYRDWHVPMGRRFRALKLWFVLRSYGAEGIRHHIRHHVRMAQDLAARLDADPRFDVIAPTPFGLVSFRLVAGDAATDALAERINASGTSYVTPSAINGMRFIRVSVGQTFTEQRHVDTLWDLIDTVRG